VGVERFVLDDGWFLGRDNDDAALGDWTPDPRKYPLGLGPLVSHVRALGMEFGLWVEPEMVNPDSQLYRAHPDWALQLAGRPLITGRNQLVLDLANPLVSDYLFEALDRLLSEHPIGYLKWDMNRDLVAAGGGDGSPAYRRQTLALYELLGRLRTAHPEVEIESCASGGGRPDLGILDHTVRVWASDNNDALARIDIQRGFLRFLPPEIMGSHIGPSPGHVTGRCHTLGFRAAVALFGHLGLELDVRALTEAQRRQVTQWLDVYKRHRGLLHGGRHYNLEGLPERCHGHGVVSPDHSQALYAVMQMDQSRLRMPPPVCLPGLDQDRNYRLTLVGPPPPGTNFDTPAWEQTLSEGLVVTGALLSEAGLQLPVLHPETALLLHLQAVETRNSA
jgi:alpha-galactosidase